MEWSVAVTRAGEDPVLDARSESTDEKVHALNDEILDFAPAIGLQPDHYTVRIAVEAPTALEAADYGLARVLSAAERAAMPKWPVVDVQVTEWGEFLSQLEQPTHPSVVGVSEVAEILGVSKQRASVLARSPSFPPPLVELASGPVWIEPNVHHFCETWERKPGRPRKKVADSA